MGDPTSALSFGNLGERIDDGIYEFTIKNAESLVINCFVCLDKTTGLLEFAKSSAGKIPCGYLRAPSTGIMADLTGDGSTKKAVVRGKTRVQWAVTGASGVADVGKAVYASDGQTLTLTVPSAGLPIGMITKYISGTTCEIYLFDYEQSIRNQSLPGLSQFSKFVGLASIGANALQGTAAATILTLPAALEHYKISSVHAQCVAHDDAVVAGSQALNLAINGTNLTGGVLTLAATNCDAAADMGSAINATAITAGNEVEVGDVVTLKMAASGTGFTADSSAMFYVYMIVQLLP